MPRFSFLPLSYSGPIRNRGRNARPHLPFLGAFLLAHALAVPTQAGPNAGVVLVMHTNDAVVYTDEVDYAGGSGVECPWDFDCPPHEFPCDSHWALLNPTSGRGADTAVWWVLAAFPPESCPRMAGITFGHAWDPKSELTLVDYGHAGDFELATSDWPSTLGSGVAVTWASPGTKELAEVYWFAGYSYDGPLTVHLVPHPTQGGYIADDSTPPQVEPIEAYGSLGLNSAIGSNPLPASERRACCFAEGACFVVKREVCETLGGRFQEISPVCSPEACARDDVPSVWTDPDAIEQTLEAGSSTAVTLRVGNSGQAPLLWRVLPDASDDAPVSTDLSGFSVLTNRASSLRGDLEAAGAHFETSGYTVSLEQVSEFDCLWWGGYAPNLDPLELAQWIRSGGSVILEVSFEDSGNWANQLLDELDVGLTLWQWFVPETTDRIAWHPITTNVDEVRFPTGCIIADGDNGGISDPSQVLVRSTFGAPRLAIARAGAGRILVTSPVFNDELLSHADNRRLGLQAFGWAAAPFWVTAEDRGTLPPAEETTIDIGIDATNLVQGDHTLDVILASDDPREPYLRVPLELHVFGTGELTASPPAIDFGPVFIGTLSTKTVRIDNLGTAPVDITELSAEPSVFGVDAEGRVLEPGEAWDVEVSFSPADLGPIEGELRVMTSPPEASLEIELVAEGIIGPRVEVEPRSIIVPIDAGQRVAIPLAIRNIAVSGGADLTWTLTHRVRRTREIASPEHPSLSDAYTFADSDDPLGPSFTWTDIATMGVPLGLSGDSWAEQSLPFALPFFGSEKSQIKVSSEGYLTFGIDGNDSSDDPIPNTQEPNDLIAIYWDSLDPAAGGEVYVLAEEERWIVQYDDVPLVSVGAALTFQAELRPHGTFEFRYLSMDGAGESGTCGIENMIGTEGIEVAHDRPYVHDGLAVRIQYGCPWLFPREEEGTVPAGSESQVMLVMDARELAPGNYGCTAKIHTNDPYTPEIAIPVLLRVSSPGVAGPRASLSPEGSSRVEIPSELLLHPVLPNPSLGAAQLRFALPFDQSVRLELFDVAGRRVRAWSLAGRAGQHEIAWDGTDESGRPIGSGVFLARIQAGAETRVQRFIHIEE